MCRCIAFRNPACYDVVHTEWTNCAKGRCHINKVRITFIDVVPDPDQPCQGCLEYELFGRLPPKLRRLPPSSASTAAPLASMASATNAPTMLPVPVKAESTRSSSLTRRRVGRVELRMGGGVCERNEEEEVVIEGKEKVE
ncbi:hypothetical protein MMC11_008868 [Xylographa trunciseda]|nr:hypothetical protein [Xylographa trunciseda]